MLRQSFIFTQDFNPRSLTGATTWMLYNNEKVWISIHAPLRERPLFTYVFAVPTRISIHAPLRERPRGCWVKQLPSNFNPRSLTGATMAALKPIGHDEISIHAPLRERLKNLLRFLRSRTFQSTLPYGSDRLNRYDIDFLPHFNPRSLTGATQYYLQVLYQQIFQSTLPYGSDLSRRSASRCRRDFNPRSLTGATISEKSRKRAH